MSRKLRLITIGMLAGISAVAQTDSSFKTMDSVIVTANKLPQKQRTTGKIITLITKEEVEKSAGKSLTQLLNEQAGITINGALNNQGTNQSLFVRGASAGRTLVLIDGIPVYDPSVINSEFDLNLIPLANVECIEICKGAQATNYGSDAVAGVINIITTKQNPTKPFNLKLNLSAGNYSTYKGSADLTGKKGRLTYSAKYSRLRTKGFSAAHDSTKSNGFDNDGFRGDVVSGNIKYQVMPSLAIKGFAQYSSNYTEIDASVFTDEKDYSHTNKALISGGGIIYSKNKIVLAANYQYSTNRRHYTNDSADRPGIAKFSSDKSFGKAHFMEVYTRVELVNGLNVLQGADYRHSSMRSTNFSMSSFGTFSSELRDSSHSQASLYASLLYNGLNEKLNVDLGGRLNVHSQYGSNSTFSFNPSYSFNPRYRVLGSIASAFKAPTLYQLYSAYGNRSLKPEKSKTYEIGLEQQSGEMKNRIVYFQRKIEDGIDFNYISNKYFNITKQKVAGIEVESKFQPLKSLTVSFNYTFLKANERSQSRENFKDTVYEYLLRRPTHHANLFVGYTFKNELFISASAKYVSKRQDIGGYKRPDVLLDDYLLLSAYGEYRLKKTVKLFADFQNITGKKFFDIRGYNSIPFLVNSGVTLNL